MRVLLVAIACVVPAPADAGDCAVRPWRGTAGSVSPGAACGAVILTTDASDAERSVGRALHTSSIEDDARVSISLRALSRDAESIHVELPGAYVLLRDGQIGLYVTEAQWAEDGWQPLPAPLEDHRLVDPTALAIDLDGDAVEVTIDGHAAARWNVPARVRSGPLAVWLHGPPGARTRLRIADASIS